MEALMLIDIIDLPPSEKSLSSSGGSDRTRHEPHSNSAQPN